MQYPRSVAVTWQTSFDRLTAPARQLLRLLSWLAPDPIPESLLESAGGPFAMSATEGGVDTEGGGGFNPRITPTEPTRALATEEGISPAPPDPRDALAELADHSLVKRSDEEPFFSVHRLVQDVTRRTLPEAEKLPCLKQALRWVDDAFVGDPGDVRTWPVLEPLAPHARAIAAFADKQDLPEPTARLMNDVGLLLMQKAQFAEAEPLFRRALAIDERRYGRDHPNVATRLNNLAQLLQDTNRLTEAEPLMRRALAIDERSFGPDHASVARDLSNLARLLLATNRLAEIEPLMRHALKIDERSFGLHHPMVAIRLNNLAGLLRVSNRLAEAEPLMRRALEIDERSYGPNYPEVARRLNNLATLLLETNRLGAVEPLYRRALDIDERSYGPDHPNVARDLNNLAQLLYTVNRLAEAEPLMRRALAIDERSYGPNHPDVARDLNNLARLLQDTNRLAEAEPLMRSAVEIIRNFKRAADYPHPRQQTFIDNYKGLLQAMGRSEGQIQATLRAMAP
jgi:tetratricopeptide (TPR) repeat protein